MPQLWIAYDYLHTLPALGLLDAVVGAFPDVELLHEIGRPTIVAAAREGVPVVRAFAERLPVGHRLVCDLKSFDVPYSSEGGPCYRDGADVVTVLAAAPDEAIREAVAGAAETARLVAFDLMSDRSEAEKAERAVALARLGATLVSCHTGLSEQAAGKSPLGLLDLVCRRLAGWPTQVVAMGGLTPAAVPALTRYARSGKLYAVAAGAAITRADDPLTAVEAFLAALEDLRRAPAA